MDKFGDRIKYARYAHGMTQEYIAHIVQTKPENVCRWESSKFAPDIKVKKAIADSLSLSIDWLVTRAGFPLLPNNIVILSPTSKSFDKSLHFISEAISRSHNVDVLFKPYMHGDSYYALYFHFDEATSIVLLRFPLGYEKAFHAFLDNQRNVNLRGDITFPDKNAETNFKTSFKENLIVYKDTLSKKPSPSQREFFFVDLYNVKKEKLIEFIYAKAKTFLEKLDKKDKLTFDRTVPEALSIYRHHHKQFKKIVRKWVQGEDLTDKDLSIMSEFTGNVTGPDILMPNKKDRWESFLIKGIKSNKFEPFSIAYAEIMSLMVEEGNKKVVRKPFIDEKNDKLYWK